MLPLVLQASPCPPEFLFPLTAPNFQCSFLDHCFQACASDFVSSGFSGLNRSNFLSSTYLSWTDMFLLSMVWSTVRRHRWLRLIRYLLWPSPFVFYLFFSLPCYHAGKRSHFRCSPRGSPLATFDLFSSLFIYSHFPVWPRCSLSLSFSAHTSIIVFSSSPAWHPQDSNSNRPPCSCLSIPF